MIQICYYAHSMLIYNTPREDEELQLLERYFYDGLIYNPNCEYIQYHSDPMGACIEIVKDASITDVAFSQLDGYVGRGVYQEVQLAIKLMKPIHIIREKAVFPFLGEFDVVKHDNRREWAKVI